MPDIALFLEVLAYRVEGASIGGGPLRDAFDFRQWLLEVSSVAKTSRTMAELFEHYPVG